MAINSKNLKFWLVCISLNIDIAKTIALTEKLFRTKIFLRKFAIKKIYVVYVANTDGLAEILRKFQVIKNLFGESLRENPKIKPVLLMTNRYVKKKWKTLSLSIKF